MEITWGKITIKNISFTKLSQNTADYYNLSVMACYHVWKNCFGQGDRTNKIWI